MSIKERLLEACRGETPEEHAEFEDEMSAHAISKDLTRLRHAAGLSLRELAKRVGTSYSQLCRLESPDYSGHSLRLVRRVARALGYRVVVQFVPLTAERDYAAAQLGTVNGMLSELKESDFVARVSLESRRDELQRELEAAEAALQSRE